MRKILLANADPGFVGDLQARFARKFEILATDDFPTAFQLIKTVPVELFLAQIPQYPNPTQYNDLKKILKKLNNKKYHHLTKILIAAKGGEYPVDEFFKLGIAAVVVDVGEVGRWIR